MSEDLKHLLTKKLRTKGNKSGNKKYTAEIIKTDLNHKTYPVLAILTDMSGEQWADRYTKYLKSSSYESLDLVEIKPYEDFKIDDPVVCWDRHTMVCRGYFAGVSDCGKPMSYRDGRGSFTNEAASLNEWDHCISKAEYEKRLKEGKL